MNRTLSAGALAFLILFTGGSGCVSTAKLMADTEIIKADVARARRNGAKRCAPRELATAEANLEFADGELSEGSSFRAAEHVQIAEASSKKALELSKDCNQKQVVLRIEETDVDGDGILDRADKCPDQAEDKDGFEDEDGCPDPDNDADGIPDLIDRCPLEAEDKDGFQDEDGCPDPDNDNDTILDAEDECPNEAGVREEKGCPKKYKNVVVTKDRIEIKQQIKFKTGSAKIIGADSFEIIREVAMALKDNPQIKKVRVEGHTDSVGADAKNLKLSQARADAVTIALITEGVQSSRLQAVGFGETKPIASNNNAAGRQENRRTDFNIIEQ